MADLFTVSAKIELDISSFQRQMQEAISEAQALSNELELSGTITLDSSEFTSGLRDAESALDGFGNRSAEADADLDTTEFDTGIEDAEGDLESLDGESAEADAGLDTSDFDTNLGDAESDLSGFEGESAEADIGLDTTDFDSGVTDVQQGMSDISTSANDLQTELDGDSSKEGGIFNGFVVGAAAAVAAIALISNAIGDAIWDAAQLGDTVVEQSHILGISTDAYQKWDFILGQNGSSIGTLRQVMRNFTTQLGSDNADFEHSLNTLSRATGDTELYMSKFAKLKPEQQFEKVIEGLRAVKGTMSDSEFNSLAQTLLGSRAYQEFGNIFDMTDAEYAAAVESGSFYATSEETMEAAGGLADKFSELSTAWQNFVINLIGAEGFDTLSSFIQNIIDMVNSITTALADGVSLWDLFTGKSDTALYGVEKIGADAEKEEALINARADRAQQLVTNLTAMEEQMGPLAQDTQTWKTAMEELEGIYPNITQAIEDNNGSFVDGKQAIHDYIEEQRKLALFNAKQSALGKYQTARDDALANKVMAELEFQAATSQWKSLATPYAEKYGMSVDDFMSKVEQAAINADISGEGATNYITSAFGVDLLPAYEAYMQAGVWQGKINDYDAAYQKANEMLTLAEQTLEEEYANMATSTGEATVGISDLATAATEAAEEIANISIPTALGGSANGLWRVPYDNYTTRLHEGEAVLTRIEAERWRDGQGGGGYIDAAATLNIGTFNSYGTSDEKTLVAALVSEQRNQLRAVGEKV